jgi:phage terminase small subunit
MHPVPLAEDGEPLETDAMEGLDAEVIEADAEAPEHSPEHLDALATQLYDRVRDRLRRELLVDRERSVTLTDWR